jgi:hypothetical protein
MHQAAGLTAAWCRRLLPSLLCWTGCCRKSRAVLTARPHAPWLRPSSSVAAAAASAPPRAQQQQPAQQWWTCTQQGSATWCHRLVLLHVDSPSAAAAPRRMLQHLLQPARHQQQAAAVLGAAPVTCPVPAVPPHPLLLPCWQSPASHSTQPCRPAGSTAWQHRRCLLLSQQAWWARLAAVWAG